MIRPLMGIGGALINTLQRADLYLPLGQVSN